LKSPYEGVKSWTKGTDIFEKVFKPRDLPFSLVKTMLQDFLVIPINENEHWTVAFVCFPGLQGYLDYGENAIYVEPDLERRAQGIKQ